MQEESEKGGDKPAQEFDARIASWRLFPTAKQEVAFAYEHGLLAQEGDTLVVITANEAMARSLAQLVQTQHGRSLRVRAVHSARQGRWVVRIPIDEAREDGLLPRGLTADNYQEVLCRTAPRTPDASLAERREAVAAAESGWRSRCRESWRRLLGAAGRRSGDAARATHRLGSATASVN